MVTPKDLKKNTNRKRVHFAENLETVHLIPLEEDRRGTWVQDSRRFRRRIELIAPMLKKTFEKHGRSA